MVATADGSARGIGHVLVARYSPRTAGTVADPRQAVQDGSARQDTKHGGMVFPAGDVPSWSFGEASKNRRQEGVRDLARVRFRLRALVFKRPVSDTALIVASIPGVPGGGGLPGYGLAAERGTGLYR